VAVFLPQKRAGVKVLRFFKTRLQDLQDFDGLAACLHQKSCKSYNPVKRTQTSGGVAKILSKKQQRGLMAVKDSAKNRW
jgi:hypothetical protein